MSERKVLNKYYPPDFDPSKIPKLRLPRNRQYSIRIMAPFNMRCNTCGEYVYKGKKFNSRKETVEDEEYLGLKIFRFYIKCPRCVAEIAFKTDPQNTDYALEGGATRNFEAMRTAEMLARKEVEEKEQEEANNPMKVLENRTKQSQQEMEMIETLEELRELNSRHAKVDTDDIVKLHAAYEEQLSKLQDEEDEKFIKEVFGKGSKDESVKRLQDDEEDNDSLEAPPPLKKAAFGQNPTDFLTQGSDSTKKASSSSSTADSRSKAGAWGRGSSSSFTSKSALAGLVRRKQPTPGGTTSDVTKSSTPHTTPGGATEQTVKVTTSMGPPLAAGTSKGSDLTSAPPQKGKESNPGKGLVNGVGEKVESAAPKAAAVPTGLGLLGAYSDSDSNSDNDSS